MHRDILLDISMRWLGVSPAGSVSAAERLRPSAVATGDPRPNPRTGRFHVQSNAPSARLFAPFGLWNFCTFAQKKIGAKRANQSRAGTARFLRNRR